MSDQMPADWGAYIREGLKESLHHLDELIDDEQVGLDTRMVALQTALTANSLDMVLPFLIGLAKSVSELRGVASQLIDRAQLDDDTRADLEQRLEHVEYATVTEGQLERLRERLTGNVADRLADRLRGEDDP